MHFPPPQTCKTHFFISYGRQKWEMSLMSSDFWFFGWNIEEWLKLLIGLQDTKSVPPIILISVLCQTWREKPNSARLLKKSWEMRFVGNERRLIGRFTKDFKHLVANLRGYDNLSIFWLSVHLPHFRQKKWGVDWLEPIRDSLFCGALLGFSCRTWHEIGIKIAGGSR